MLNACGDSTCVGCTSYADHRISSVEMKNDRPFLEDGSQFGVSRTAFRRMRKAEKRELMIEWFHQNFEDPAERTSYVSAEEGYLWNWGGPYDAGDQLYAKFGDIVPESLIKEVTEEVEKDGLTDWAPTPNRDDYDDYDPPDEPPSLDIFLDEPSDAYGTPQDHEARDRARAALDELQKALDSQRPIGIGHNQPPEEVGESDEIRELRPALLELRAEFSKPNPAINLVRRWAQPLRQAIVATGKWTARKLDKAADAAFKAAAVGAVGLLGTHYHPQLQIAFDAVMHWLEIVARPLF